MTKVIVKDNRIFLIPDDAVAQNLIIIFNFSNERPHSNYNFLSNVYSFHTINGIFHANLLIFTNKASGHVVIV